MLRIISAVVIVVSFSAAVPAQAQWLSSSKCEHSAWQRYWASWRANNSWPIQWVPYDRAAVCVPLSIQEEKGWHRMNLLGSFHFEEGSNQLNEAGVRKVRYILTQQLPERRTIFVERGISPAITDIRIDAVQQTAVAMLPAGELPDVADTNMILDGWPADDVDATLRGFDKSRPSPRLPAATSQSNTAGDVN